MIFERKDAIKELLGWGNFDVPMDLWPTEPVEGIGPCDSDFFTKFVMRRRKAEELLVQHLDTLNNEELSELLADEQKQKHLRWELKLQGEPNWYDGGFNVSGRKADYSHWAKMEYWSDVEACCLSIGFNPQDIDGPYKYGPSGTPSNFFHKRLEIIKRLSVSEDNDAHHRPSEFCRWALEKGIEVNTGLLESVSGFTEFEFPNDAPALGCEGDRLESREKTSLAVLIVAMAVELYGYDPSAPRSPVPKEIQGVADRLGLEIGLDTIRKYLKLGAEKLPKDYKP